MSYQGLSLLGLALGMPHSLSMLHSPSMPQAYLQEQTQGTP